MNQRPKRAGLIVGSVVACLLLFSAIGLSQRTTANIYGIVKDSSGAVVPGITITLTNELTGIEQKATTNESGEFSATFLPVGRYTITVSAQGFKTFVQRGLELTAGQQIRYPVTLELGEITQKIDVTAEAPLLQNASATLRDNVSKTQLEELPLGRRDFTSLLTLQNGVRADQRGFFQMNGLATAGISVTADGVDASPNPQVQGISMVLGFNQIQVMSLEAIQEINISRGVFSAEQGNTYSGNINLITKSGTNKFHGSLFENWQNDILNARSFFATARPVVRFNQFGGSLGGPIIKNRAFFFFTYEGYRQQNQAFLSALMPTPEWKALAITALPAYKPVLDRFQTPTDSYAPGAVSALFRGVVPDTASDNHIVLRGDYQLNSTNSLTVRYTRDRPHKVDPALPVASSRSYIGKVDSGVLTWTHTAPTWTSETRLGTNYTYSTALAEEIIKNRIARIEVTGFFTMSSANAIWAGHTYTMEEIIAKNVGRHTIKFGGIHSVRAPGAESTEFPAVRYGNPAAMLANTPNRVRFNLGSPRVYMRSWQIGTFIQDDFRIRPNVTLNLGVRYEYNSVVKEKYNRLFNPGTPENAVKTPPVFRPGDSLYDSDPNNILPRVGVSWGLGRDQKTVVRSGFGIASGPLPLDVLSELARWDAPIGARLDFTGSDITRLGLRYPVTNEQGFDLVRNSTAPRGYNVYDQNTVNPYSMQWTLDVQRQLTPSLVLQTGYVGNKGLKVTMFHLGNFPDRFTGNRPVPEVLSFNYRSGTDNSWYHGWQTSLRKHFADGLLMNLNYAWAKSMAFSVGDFQTLNDARVQDGNNVRGDKGLTNLDRAQDLRIDVLYEIPLARSFGSSGFMKQIFGGWQIAGIFRAQSGLGVNVIQSSGRDASRPDYIGGTPYLESHDISDLYLNPSAFGLVPVSSASSQPLRPGNVGKMSLRGPGLWNIDMNLAKNFEIREAIKLQLRLDMFNALNHTNWGTPVADLNTSTFGRILTTGNSRSMQLALRLAF